MRKEKKSKSLQRSLQICFWEFYLPRARGKNRFRTCDAELQFERFESMFSVLASLFGHTVASGLLPSSRPRRTRRVGSSTASCPSKRGDEITHRRGISPQWCFSRARRN